MNGHLLSASDDHVRVVSSFTLTKENQAHCQIALKRNFWHLDFHTVCGFKFGSMNFREMDAQFIIQAFYFFKNIYIYFKAAGLQTRH